jgi:hypothetical protein
MQTKMPELNNFQAWTKIKNSIDWDSPVSVLKDWEHLKSTLDSGLMEEVLYHPDYTRQLGNVPPELIAQYTWLLPTKMGLMCYELFCLLQEQRLKTKKAYQQGKYDAVSTLCAKMYELTDVDPSDFQDD